MHSEELLQIQGKPQTGYRAGPYRFLQCTTGGADGERLVARQLVENELGDRLWKRKQSAWLRLMNTGQEAVRS